MHLKDFYYELPKNLIARYPLANRTASRLLCIENGNLQHRQFTDLPSLLQPGDLMVFNDTRVIPARLYGTKLSGGKIEILIERLLDEHHTLAHVRSNKTLRIGTELRLDNDVRVIIEEKKHNLFILYFQDQKPLLEILNQIGHMPLPPYMDREDELSDKERYQTVFGQNPGAVAAPTAGLHFDQPLLDKIKKMGVEIAFVTLHVGAGTFQPVRTEHIEDHKIHSEYIEVSEQVCEQIKATKARGNRVIAVGTTSLRCLETANQQPYKGDTQIFIYPGYQFRCVDALITNFHLPESTLLMLVCAFAGYDTIMHAYQEAIGQGYRFFSYGDAMWMTR